MSGLSDQAIHRPGLLSIVIPLRNNADTILPLLREIDEVLSGAIDFEIVCIDDGSGDETRSRLVSAQGLYPNLRCFGHDKPCGRGAAVHSGVICAKGDLVLTIDGDGRNEPADIPLLLNALLAAEKVAPVSTIALAMIAGIPGARSDAGLWRIGSRIARAIRPSALRDRIWHAASGLNLFVREAYLSLPYAEDMHRSLPALMQRHGYSVASMPVAGRRPPAGRTGSGAWKRAAIRIASFRGAIWPQRYSRRPSKI